jgi:hypothetical protein
MSRERQVAILAEAVKEQYGAKDVLLADDGEHVYLDGLDEDGEHIVFRYFVPPETWASIEAFERGEIESQRIELRPPDDQEGGA